MPACPHAHLYVRPRQLLLRRVDPAVLGHAFLRCDLLLATTLFLSREGLRLSLVRQAPGSDATPQARRARQALVNLAWLAAPVGVALSLLVAALDWRLHPDEPPAQKQVALLYCAGGALEVRSTGKESLPPSPPWQTASFSRARERSGARCAAGSAPGC